MSEEPKEVNEEPCGYLVEELPRQRNSKYKEERRRGKGVGGKG